MDHTGQYSAALSALKKAVALQPDHPDVHRSLIRLFHNGTTLTRPPCALIARRVVSSPVLPRDPSNYRSGECAAVG
jgi:hypothetical protein